MNYIKDLVSIITPCYNGELYLDRYFTSILNQTYPFIQVIIIDDGSTDKTGFVIEKYRPSFNQKNIQLVHLSQKNSGQAVAVNKALEYVAGEFLVWPDCDDYYEADALESMVNFLKANSFNFIRGISAFRKENNLNEIVRYGKSKRPNNLDIFDSYIFETDSYTFAGIFMVKMEYFDSCFKDRKIFSNTRAGQNWQLILPLAYHNECGYLDKLVYNVVLTNESHSRKRMNLIEELRRINDLKNVLMNSIYQIDLSGKERKSYYYKVNIKYFKVIVKVLSINPIKRVIKKLIKR